MVRPLRIEYENAYYHVMNRGRGRRSIFHKAEYYELFLDCLEQAHQRFGIEIHAYCLMGNHYHLLVKTPRGNLSRAMRHINGVYTQKYNLKKKTDGPLFRGRYKAILIDNASYLLEVSRYIHRNPVELNRPLVHKLIDYKWSSYPTYANRVKSPTWLMKDDVFGELSAMDSVPAYKRFVGKGLDEETRHFYSRDEWPAVRGSREFIEQAHGCSLSFSNEIAKDRGQKEISMNHIISLVAKHFDCKTSVITIAKRGRGAKNYPRWIAMKLCQDLSGQTLSVIAQKFNVGNYCTVSRTIGRLKKTLEKDGELLSKINSISKDLTP